MFETQLLGLSPTRKRSRLDSQGLDGLARAAHNLDRDDHARWHPQPSRMQKRARATSNCSETSLIVAGGIFADDAAHGPAGGFGSPQLGIGIGSPMRSLAHGTFLSPRGLSGNFGGVDPLAGGPPLVSQGSGGLDGALAAFREKGLSEILGRPDEFPDRRVSAVMGQGRGSLDLPTDPKRRASLIWTNLRGPPTAETDLAADLGLTPRRGDVPDSPHVPELTMESWMARTRKRALGEGPASPAGARMCPGGMVPVVAEEERVPTAAHAHPEPASEGPSRRGVAKPASMPAFDAGVGPSVPLPALPPLPAGPLPGLPTGLLGAAALALLGDPTWEAPADSAPGTSGRGQARGRDPAVDRFADAAFSDLRSMFVQLYGQETRSKNRTWLVKQVVAAEATLTAITEEVARRARACKAGEGGAVSVPLDPQAKRQASDIIMAGLGAAAALVSGGQSHAAPRPLQLVVSPEASPAASATDAGQGDGDGGRGGAPPRVLHPWDLAQVDWAEYASGHRVTVDLTGAAPRDKKEHRQWTEEETRALVDGVEACGGGKWAEIKKMGGSVLKERSPVDLKDKWRNLARLAVSHGGDGLTGSRRKAGVPADILQRVRTLASIHVPKWGSDGRPMGGGARSSPGRSSRS